MNRLAAARGLSVLGDIAAYIALVAAVDGSGGSSLWVAVVILATLGLSGAVTPLSGWLGDSGDRRVIMLVSDVACAGCFCVLSLVDAPLPIVLLAVVATLAQAPFGPASSGVLPNLVSIDDLAWANGRLSVATNAGNVVGPLLGGVAVATAGSDAAFLLNALTFLASAAFVATLRGSFRARPASHAEHEHSRDWRGGFRYVFSNPTLRVLVPAAGTIALALGLLLPAEPALAEELGWGTTGFGLMVSAWAIGAILSSVVTGRQLIAGDELRAVRIGAAMLVIACAGASVAPWFALILPAMALAGAGQGVLVVTVGVALQHSTPDALRSRVAAVDGTLSQLGWAAGALGAGVALQFAEPSLIYAGAAIVIALAGAVVATRRRTSRAVAA